MWKSILATLAAVLRRNRSQHESTAACNELLHNNYELIDLVTRQLENTLQRVYDLENSACTTCVKTLTPAAFEDSQSPSASIRQIIDRLRESQLNKPNN